MVGTFGQMASSGQAWHKSPVIPEAVDIPSSPEQGMSTQRNASPQGYLWIAFVQSDSSLRTVRHRAAGVQD